MFLNLLPIISFLILCFLLSISDSLVKRQLIPEFFTEKLVSGVFGSIILFWGLFLFYTGLNYYIYAFKTSPISVFLRLLTVSYFIFCGFVLFFKGAGRLLFNRQPVSIERYYLFLRKLSETQPFLAKASLFLILIYILNYLLA